MIEAAIERCAGIDIGKIRPSFIPERTGRELRDLTRWRRLRVIDALYREFEDVSATEASTVNTIRTRLPGRHRSDFQYFQYFLLFREPTFFGFLDA